MNNQIGSILSEDIGVPSSFHYSSPLTSIKKKDIIGCLTLQLPLFDCA